MLLSILLVFNCVDNINAVLESVVLSGAHDCTDIGVPVNDSSRNDTGAAEAAGSRF